MLRTRCLGLNTVYCATCQDVRSAGPPMRLRRRSAWLNKATVYPPRPVAPAAAPAHGPRAIAALPRRLPGRTRPAPISFGQAISLHGNSRTRYKLSVSVLKGAGEDGATWIDSTGGVVATQSELQLAGGNLASHAVLAAGKYKGRFTT